jgi:hypothetical protein
LSFNKVPNDARSTSKKLIPYAPRNIVTGQLVNEFDQTEHEGVQPFLELSRCLRFVYFHFAI